MAFFMICRSPRHPGAKTEPTKRYATEADARADAQRLADQTGHPFVILHATTTVWPTGQQDRLI